MGENLMATSREKASYNLRRFLNFLKLFFRNKRGTLGMAILIVFVIMAVGAPFLTPYDPMQTKGLSARIAAPAWARNLPGGEYLTENFYAVQDAGFTKPDSIKQWNFTTNPKGKGVSMQYVSNVGYPQGSGPGSVAITFRREETGRVYRNVSASFAVDFYYPYKGLPGRFMAAIALTCEGTSEIVEGKALLDVPAKINVFMRVENYTYNLWPQPYPYNPITPSGEQPMSLDGEVQTTMSSMWISSKQSPIDSAWPGLLRKLYGTSYITTDPTTIIFNRTRIPNTFTYGVEITFEDVNVNNRDKKVETTIYLDDLQVSAYGTAFGILGTDQLGRDIFSQLIYGARLSLYIGILTSVISVLVGLIIGLAAGYLGKLADEIMMRFTDMLLVLPTLPLMIVLVAVLGANLTNLIIILSILGWMGFARTVRSQVLSLRERPFIEAAKAIGAGKTHIIIRHILPNIMGLVYVTLATSVPGAIVAEAALSWLGFFWGPNVTSWGRMLHDVQATEGATSKLWWVLPPGLSIAAIALSFILLGYALDDVLNPKLRVRR